MMKKEHARTAILREWPSWTRSEKISGKATRLQAMKFYTFLQTQRSHLLGFKHDGDKWQIVHAWLRRAGKVE